MKDTTKLIIASFVTSLVINKIIQHYREEKLRRIDPDQIKQQVRMFYPNYPMI